MDWVKKGKIFRASGQTPWMESHTAMPMALWLQDDSYRIYFGARDRDNRPSASFIDIDINNPAKTDRISAAPVLTAGKPGFFDDNGVYPGSVIRVDDKIYMYYMGRSNGENGLYYMAIGLAISCDGGEHFERFSEAPILGRSHQDPWMVTTPWVIRDGDTWKMWYTSGIGWSDGLKTSYYHIKYTESEDGLNWKASDKVAIPLEGEETNVAAPTVYKENGIYHMWFSVVPSKKQSYTIGYAASENGADWQRQYPGKGLLSSGDWDDMCMAYPCVFSHKQRLYLIYSGNQLGKAGIGVAISEK